MVFDEITMLILKESLSFLLFIHALSQYTPLQSFYISQTIITLIHILQTQLSNNEYRCIG